MKNIVLIVVLSFCHFILQSQKELKISQTWAPKTTSRFEAFEASAGQIWATSFDGIGDACSAVLINPEGKISQSFEFTAKKSFPGELFISFAQDGEQLLIITASINEKESHLIMKKRSLGDDGALSDASVIWDTHGSRKLNIINDKYFLQAHSPDRRNHALCGLNGGENFAVFNEHWDFKYEGQITLGMYDRTDGICVSNNGEMGIAQIFSVSKGLQSGVRNVKLLYVADGGKSPFVEHLSPLSGGNLGKQLACFDSNGLLYYIGFTYSGSTTYTLSNMGIISFNPKNKEVLSKEYNIEKKPVFAFNLVPSKPEMSVFTNSSGHMIITGGSSPATLKAEISVMDIDTKTWKYEAKSLTTSPYVMSQAPLENYLISGQKIMAYQICDDKILGEVTSGTEIKAKAGKGEKMHVVLSSYGSGEPVKKNASTETFPGGLEFENSPMITGKDGRVYQIATQGKSKVLLSWK